MSGVVRRLRGFTLLELIVVILILGILAAIAIVAYPAVTEKAHVAAAQADLHQFGTAALAHATLDGDATLTRAVLIESMADADVAVVDAGTHAEQTTWNLIDAEDTPTGRDEVSVVFDDGDGTDTSNTSGTRAVLATSTGKHLVGTVVTLAGGTGSGDGSGVGCAFVADQVTSAQQYVTDHPGQLCKTGDTSSGGDGDTSTGAVADVADTISGWPILVDVLTNDTDTPAGVAALTTPEHGTAGVQDDVVLYAPDDTYVGTDSFTYTSSTGGTATVTITVGPATEPCDDAAGTPADAACATEPPGDPITGITGVGNATAADVTAVTSYPHSNAQPYHYLYATTSTGGVIWVRDDGVSGRSGQAVAPGTHGCSTPLTGADPTCATGWLYAPGTFDTPTAMATGEGPGHGSVRSTYTYDTMFVADADGVWSSPVNAFTRSVKTSLLVDADAFTGTVTTLAVDPSTALVWVGTDAGYTYTLDPTADTPAATPRGRIGTTPSLAVQSCAGTFTPLARTDAGLWVFTAGTWQRRIESVPAGSGLTLDHDQLVLPTATQLLSAPLPTSVKSTIGWTVLAEQGATLAHSHGVAGQLYVTDTHGALQQVRVGDQTYRLSTGIAGTTSTVPASGATGFWPANHLQYTYHWGGTTPVTVGMQWSVTGAEPVASPTGIATSGALTYTVTLTGLPTGAGISSGVVAAMVCRDGSRLVSYTVVGTSTFTLNSASPRITVTGLPIPPAHCGQGTFAGIVLHGLADTTTSNLNGALAAVAAGDAVWYLPPGSTWQPS